MATLPPSDAIKSPGDEHTRVIASSPPIEPPIDPSLGHREGSIEEFDPTEEQNTTSANRFGAWIGNNSTAFACSLVVHVALLLLLALWILRPESIGFSGRLIEVRTATADPESLDPENQQVSLNPGQGGVQSGTEVDPNPEAQPTVALPTVNDLASSENSQAGKSIPSLNPIAKSSPSLQHWVAATDNSELAEMFRPSSTGQRRAGERSSAAGANGGTRQSEEAVEAGLRWLIAHQKGDGSWSLGFKHEECGSDCQNEGTGGDYSCAATGLALLSFLGAGYSHREGPYQEQLRKAIYYLLTRIQYSETNGIGNLAGLSEHQMYNHGIATLALCEAYQMTQDKDLKDPVSSLVQYIARAQHQLGGWGYSSGQPGDLTISAWQVMALKSAHQAGIQFPSNVMRQFDKFLDSQQSGGGAYYGYRAPGKQPGTTAMGLLLRMYRGWHQTDPRLLEGLGYLEKTGVSVTDIYYDFYATQAFFHHDGPAWTQWNERMRDFLVKNQETRGHAQGSWYFVDSFSKVGGRLYCTCMSILTLEVYYRYPPMFRELTPDSFEF
jgi:hypothetical protein